ncbi:MULTISPECIES: Arc family DNA-binding protein [Stutzerimonas]|uniref:Arc family DNA-binding protein n=1 Tax=Stutzerimonas TaxID=2901164 RepID=UPI00265A0134|nr:MULTISPECIES: Arc family DNA-binding protein [Stutzerimonas]MCF6780920.1 Arc family DNA-binding protein [Stutzerimonas stutzeri]MCF6803489.1 Arc family DNA-binding protein [Stutzerimonas stutzeri]
MKPEAQFKLRLPQDIKEWLSRRAQAGYHSMQAEVLGIIAEAKRKDESQQLQQA